VEAFSYLYTIAAAGMSFAGLSVLTMILRQMLGGQMTKFDSFVARTWFQLGFMVTFGSILPPQLALLEVPTPMVWRLSSGVMAIMLGWWALKFPLRRQATNPTPLPIQVIIFRGGHGSRCARGACDCSARRAFTRHLCCSDNRDTCLCCAVVPVHVRALVRRDSVIRFGRFRTKAEYTA
jgi:hypothetical protein